MDNRILILILLIAIVIFAMYQSNNNSPTTLTPRTSRPSGYSTGTPQANYQRQIVGCPVRSCPRLNCPSKDIVRQSDGRGCELCPIC